MSRSVPLSQLFLMLKELLLTKISNSTWLRELIGWQFPLSIIWLTLEHWMAFSLSQGPRACSIGNGVAPTEKSRLSFEHAKAV
ncbi:hypothetical protein POPTR_009G129851v4 [Populus trichocarpa]|uniref:Uncharacterized protein n=1 Tax=Populus trichocarpa TaxID=3694 RepID=A0ACC0SI21_POPTR|nr:hypothetical protein BDE02_09G114700 [Populus trichocarpa]KAI9388870.1 hypothetical protein POPTR_009G129851v4 [Populus trichocarpa]